MQIRFLGMIHHRNYLEVCNIVDTISFILLTSRYGRGMGDTLEGPLLWAYDRSHCLAFQGEDQFLLASVALILPTLRLCGLYGRRRYR